MTDTDLVVFLEWLRTRWVLAELRHFGPGKSGLFVESITNQAVVDLYRKQERSKL